MCLPLTFFPQVSAFSTWEKELHKIVFDPRYLLLNSEERKQVSSYFGSFFKKNYRLQCKIDQHLNNNTQKIILLKVKLYCHF